MKNVKEAFSSELWNSAHEMAHATSEEEPNAKKALENQELELEDLIIFFYLNACTWKEVRKLVGNKILKGKDQFQLCEKVLPKALAITAFTFTIPETLVEKIADKVQGLLYSSVTLN